MNAGTKWPRLSQQGLACLPAEEDNENQRLGIELPRLSPQNRAKAALESHANALLLFILYGKGSLLTFLVFDLHN